MIDNQFNLSKIIGKGGSSKVFLAKDTEDNMVAIKAIRKDKNYSYKACWQMLEREYALWTKMLHHPNIINSYGVNYEGSLTYQDRSETIMYIVLEYAQNGAIANFIRHSGPVQEEVGRVFVHQLWHAIEFIHNEGYCHLDIKLENILFDQFYNIKLADLGSCIQVADSKGCTDRRRGTLKYMAPEVTHLEHGQEFNAFSADIYSLGITLFVLLTGEFPSPDEINWSISTDGSEVVEDFEYNIPKSNWHKLSVNTRKLIMSMTNRDPEKRPNIQEILNNEWLSFPFSSEIFSKVYEEMESRKDYIRELLHNG